MLELWRMRSMPSLPSLPGSLWHGMVATNRVLSMGQIELQCILMLNWIAWNRTVLIFELSTYANNMYTTHIFFQSCLYLQFQCCRFNLLCENQDKEDTARFVILLRSILNTCVGIIKYMRKWGRELLFVSWYHVTEEF